jgi:leader peptidase (prepilin peptidase)/N-methyltransferase
VTGALAGSLTAVGGVLGLLLGPWLAATTVRLARRDPAARPSRLRTAVTALLAAAALAGAAAVTGVRPAVVALAWLGASAVVLGGVDLMCHRLPDRITFPTAAGCAVALLADATITGAWAAVARAGVAAAAAYGLATVARLLSPGGLGGGDVKLLGLLGLVLGWAGWGVLIAGVFAGFLAGALGSVLLIAVGRAGWRTRVAFGPPLLVGGCIALALAAPLPVPF